LGPPERDVARAKRNALMNADKPFYFLADYG
jgi:hypothetical protein